MRCQSLFLTILLAAAGAYALTPAERDKSAAEAAPEVDADSGERGRRKSQAPAATFTPSEKIEADSAVSFPVDI